MTGWLLLLAGITLEVVSTVLLRGLREVPPNAATFTVAAVAMLASLALFAAAIQTVPLAVAYTGWAGIGTAAIVLIDALGYHEPLTTLRGFSILLVVIGVVGLNLPAPS